MIIILIIILIVVTVAVVAYSIDQQNNFSETNDVINQNRQSVEVVATGLRVPWEIAFLSDGDMLVTERNGYLKRIGKEPASIKIDGTYEHGEGGLLGLAIHPDFSRNNFIYIYLTSRDLGVVENRVERYVFKNNSLGDKKVIVDNIPGGQFHDGGRIKFGPDKMLYITTGDAQNEDFAQNTSVLAGKILRVRDDGTIPEDNPFSNAIYSYGHRNPQGLSWDDKGQLWSTEHGRSGVQSGLDEINLIIYGGNYGWPNIEGDETSEGMRNPVLHSGGGVTWAPAGMAFKNGKLYFGGLQGEALYEVEVDGMRIANLKTYFKGEYGRVRAVAIGPDGFLYMGTSNTDGRGSVKSGDDKIIRINTSYLK